MRHNARKSDDNQEAIVTALRAIGCTVEVLSSVGDGCPDLLVGFRGHNYLVEVKNIAGRGHDRLTPAQVTWHMLWRGQVNVVRSVDEALALFGVVR